MARRFRFYQKKRGSRRTGSQKLGSLGETVFFAVFFLLGCGGLVAMCATFILPQWKAQHEYVTHQCLVLDSRLAEQEDDGATLYRPEIQIEYEIDGETYRTWTYDVGRDYSPHRVEVDRILEHFRPDPERRYACWYNPDDPNVAVLVRGSNWWAWLTLIVPVSFVLIGGGGLVYQLSGWGRSEERRADWVRRAGRMELFETNGRPKTALPGVPGAARITDSPGTKLAFRLPAATSSTWTLVVTLTACVVWNGIVSTFVFSAVRGHVRGQPDWFLTLFLVPFVLIGVGLAVYFVRQLLRATGIGPTLVEISGQPLHPGKRYEVFLSQAGRLKFRSLKLLLVCDEETTFCHGTNTRTETHRVYEQPIFEGRTFEVGGGGPFETECEVRMPPDAMHSFKSDHNEVNWRMIVRGKAAGRPGFERTFEVIVHPAPNGKDDS